MKYWLLVLLLFAAPCLASERSVHDLGAVKPAIKQPEGRRSFADQIEGNTRTAALGTALPTGLDRDVIGRLVAPHVAPATITLVGAWKWPHLANGYVAIVCAAHTPPDRQSAAAGQFCENHPDVFLGVLVLPPGGEPMLVARTKPGFALTSDWSPPDGVPLLTPDVSPASSDADNESQPGRADDEVVSFDLAPYRITPDMYAFGLRSDKDEGYSGGYGTFETLHLFLVDGSELRRILAQPIYGFRMTAGQWHSNGTREHQVDEAKLVVAIAPSMTAGHYDLLVKQMRGRDKTVLRWDAAKGVYWVPGGTP